MRKEREKAEKRQRNLITIGIVVIVLAVESESFTNPWSRETLVWELKNSDVTRAYLLRDGTLHR